MRFTYLLVDFFTIIVPFIFSFHPKLRFNKNFKSFFLANSLAAVIFLIWDAYYTKLGVWGFNPDYLIGVEVYNLPIEEVLFFICIPFSCVFTYHCLGKFYKLEMNKGLENLILFAIVSGLAIIGFVQLDKLYTSATFISLASLIIVLKFLFRVNWIGKLLIIYPVLLLPFFIVNGILTGTGLDEPVVWYNNNENLNLRLFTIPIEDIFYGLELIILNVFFYELMNDKVKLAQRNLPDKH